MVETNTLPPVTDTHSAAAHIAGLLDMSATPSDTSDVDTAPSDMASQSDDADAEHAGTSDLAPEETPASEPTTEDENEPAAGDEPSSAPPIIEPPLSWNAAEKKLFADLPPEMQTTIARRESERETANNRRMQEIAEQRKAVEAETVRATQQQQQYAQTINQLLAATIPELKQVENVDWLKLSKEDPSEYVRLSAVRDNIRQRVQFMSDEMQQAQQQADVQIQAQKRQALADQYSRLVEAIPEFSDPAKAKVLVTDIGSTMSGYGFSPEEIGAVGDARVVKVMARLAQLERQEAARKSALTKKGGAPAPRQLPQNAGPVAEDNQSQKLKEQFAALRRSGSTRDAARLIENIL